MRMNELRNVMYNYLEDGVTKFLMRDMVRTDLKQMELEGLLEKEKSTYKYKIALCKI